MGNRIHFNQYISKNMLSKLGDFIENFKGINDINLAIECYKVQKYVEFDKEIAKFRDINFKKEIGKYLPSNFTTIDYSEITKEYRKLFWEMISQYNKLEADSEEFLNYVKDNRVPIDYLMNIKMIEKFPKALHEIFISNPRNIEFFINHQSDKFLSEKGIYSKIGLSDADINQMAIAYCEWEHANPNYLRFIIDYKKLSRYTFFDETKLVARRKDEEITDELFEKSEGGVSYNYEIGIRDLDADKLFEASYISGKFTIYLNKTWLDENQDYPTLLNNFIYVLGFYNYNNGLSIISVNSSILSLSKMFSSHSNADYLDYDKTQKMVLSWLFMAYYNYLKDNNIELEEVIEWYFNHYLIEELGISDFHYHATNPSSTYYERGKALAGEFDSILDQYDLFNKNGHIDSELLSIRSKASYYADLKSFCSEKFVSLIKNDEHNTLYKTLFTDQSPVAYIKDRKETTFYELVNSGVSYWEFDEYQQQIIDNLIEKGVLLISQADRLEFIQPLRIWLLRKVWEKGSYCLFYQGRRRKEVIRQLVTDNYLKYEDTLFSQTESNYLSFILDDKKYGNGLKLRNRVTHGKFSREPEEEHFEAYLELLQVLIFYVIRINDELEYHVNKHLPFDNPL